MQVFMKDTQIKILIMGISGLIGKELYHCLSERYNVTGTYCQIKPQGMEYADLRHFAVEGSFGLTPILEEIKPDVVLSCLRGGFEEQLTIHSRLAGWLASTGGRCIYLSTANVFDGLPGSIHGEQDTPHPISVYGKFKYACETLLQERLDSRCLIARLPFTISADSARRFVLRVAQGEKLYSNLYMNCNTARRVALSIRYLMEKEIGGIVHLTSTDAISQDEYFVMLAKHLGLDAVGRTVSIAAEDYAKALGCEDASLIDINPAGPFYLALSDDSSFDYGLDRCSCEEIICGLSENG